MPSDMNHYLLSLWRGCRRGVVSAVRGKGFMASLAALTSVLFLCQVMLLLTLSVQAAMQLVRERTDLRLEILDTATDGQIQDLLSGIRSLPYVDEALYITREQAYERASKRDPQLLSFLQKFGIGNPFPETVGVRLKQIDDYPAFKQFLGQDHYATTINPSFLSQATDQESQLTTLIDAVGSLRVILGFVSVLLLIVLLTVVIELVRRRAIERQDELLIEELVGAQRAAIAVPFLCEMLLLLAIGLLVSSLFAGATLFALPTFVPSVAPTGLFASWAEHFTMIFRSMLPTLLLSEIAFLPVLALVATVIALKPALKFEILSLS